MTPRECRFEEEALAAAVQSRWPARVEPELLAHVESCPVCSDVVAVASPMQAAYEELLATAEVPDAGRVWRLARLRGRYEAVQAAGLPITAVQLIALASAMGLLGACFGATSTWFQSALRSVVSGISSLDPGALYGFMAALPSGYLALLAGLAVLVLVVPTAVLLALARD